MAKNNGKKKNGNGKQKQAAAPKENKAVFDLSNMQFWRDVAKSLFPDEGDEMRIGEVATALRLQTGLLASNWKDINRIAANTGEQISISWGWKIDRSKHPSVIKLSGSFSEKHPMKGESDVPDPDQSDLPGLTAPEEDEGEQQVAASAEAEESEEARVRSADEKDGE